MHAGVSGTCPTVRVHDVCVCVQVLKYFFQVSIACVTTGKTRGTALVWGTMIYEIEEVAIASDSILSCHYDEMEYFICLIGILSVQHQQGA